ncbi:hypothetical protein SELMODRAFT_271658 [Selaginella moellendorffii]|uniref:CRAL-TRIO domain-containing protein n=2 Tax=Selaginella moellendorffii TaxID=88036 RepID=D8SK62_SELML|nr:phosphatidylinositol/phosphatidylcholine transfer protein SFH2 isoform X1 [Selaginella moellendorffii]EFJ15172.1 hypothetical protein SELMODRAFT_271658 [Selaginella moellendorffii]|eukprot:XP_002983676.1 phosphatidylinositol/phosphatidylcholine transfer protein SFH2 isoform X1 [Selaginella moellendorffii]
MDCESIKQMEALLEQADEPLQRSFQNMHQGFKENNLERFLRAREGNVVKANKMLVDSLNWRVSNDIDDILSKPIEPKELYDAIRESQLVGMSGFDKQGRPVFAIGVGHSGYDRAPLDKYVQSHIQINEYRDRVVLPAASRQLGRYVGSCLKILDMTGLKLSALNRIKILTVISTIDDLNYPEKTDAYYIVNAPYVFTACWKAVKPLLQERTKKKIKVLQGSGREELLKVMDASVIPEFCRPSKESRGKTTPIEPSTSCFSSSHPFHIELWSYIKQRALESQSRKCGPAPTLSFHVKVPDKASEGSSEVVQIIESTLEHLNLDEDGSVSGNGSTSGSNHGSSHHGTDDEASSKARE